MSLFGGYGFEVDLKERQDFLKVMETLTRMGVANEDESELIQSCHILHKRGHYAIMHYNEMYAIDGDLSRLSPENVEQRNAVVRLLTKWGLVKPTILETSDDDNAIEMGNLRVIQFSEKNDWKLSTKYVMGQKKGARR